MNARGLVFGVIFGLVAWLVILGVVLVAAHAGTSDPLRYRTADGRVLVVRGDRCFSQEDVTELRLVEYIGPDKVIYRCLTP